MALILRLTRTLTQRNLQATTATASLSRRYISNQAAAAASDGNVKATVNKNKNKELQVSQSCIKRLREICKDGNFLRVTVEGGGCSGFQYKFNLDKQLNDDDVTFGDGEAKVVIDNISLEYCAGSTVDYHEELIRAGFRIMANPKAEQGCSCGASFAIKLD